MERQWGTNTQLKIQNNHVYCTTILLKRKHCFHESVGLQYVHGANICILFFLAFNWFLHMSDLRAQYNNWSETSFDTQSRQEFHTTCNSFHNTLSKQLLTVLKSCKYKWNLEVASALALGCPPPRHRFPERLKSRQKEADFYQ